MVGLAVIAALVLAFLWTSRLGDVGKGLGEGVRAFKRSLNESRPPRRKKKQQHKQRAKKPARELEEGDVIWERRRVRAHKPPPADDEEN